MMRLHKEKRGEERSAPSPRAYRRASFSPLIYLMFVLVMLATLVLCVSVGSVNIPFGQTASIVAGALAGHETPQTTAASIILTSRLPRVLCVALTGASLSICGAAMQGLLKNPLADGSTLGVSSGASLGAVTAIAFNITFPGLPFAGTVVMAMLFAFASIVIILAIAYRLDYSLSTNSIILIGVIYSMFASSLLSLVMTFSSDKLHNITFWTMGSLAGSSYRNALVLLAALMLCGGVLLRLSRELNAFAVGEDNARHVGVNVRAVRLTVLIAVSALIGVCVSIGGTIAFVGLVTPHIVRMITGPNHARLLPASLFAGSSFLMLCDLAARMIANPLQLPIGVVTSLIGAVVFLVIFYRSGRANA